MSAQPSEADPCGPPRSRTLAADHASAPGAQPHGHGGGMSLAARARALWQHRRILWLLIQRDLKVRYAGSVLGYVWTILDPLLMTAVYWFVFTQVFHRNARGEQPYIVFLILGLLA